MVVLDADGEVVQKEADVPNGQTPYWEQDIMLPDNGSEFDGTIIVNVKDRLENTDAQSGNVIVESEQAHQAQEPVQMEILTEPGRIVDGEAYYRSDVQVKYIFTDKISGLGKMFLKAGSELTEETNYLEQAGTDRTESPGQPITLTCEWEGTIMAEHNNQNDGSGSGNRHR